MYEKCDEIILKLGGGAREQSNDSAFRGGRKTLVFPVSPAAVRAQLSQCLSVTLDGLH